MNAKLISSMLTNWFTRSNRRASTFKRRSQQNQQWAAAEVLEIRQVPSATAVLQAGVLTITGSDQADNIVVTKAGTKLAVSGVTATFTASSVRSIVVNAGGGDDTVDLTAVSVPTKVSGGAGNDSLTGGSGNDTLLGKAGNDVLRGNAGNDLLDGGSDLDLVSEIANANFVLTNSKLTGAGIDTLSNIETASLAGGAGNNRLDATQFSGSVTLHGGAGNDTLIGGSADDEVFGEIGNDVVDGGAGIDTVDGIGNDVSTNSERLLGQGIEGHDESSSANFVTLSKWGNQTFGTAAIVTYSFMPSGVRDSSNSDGGWTNTAVTSFMPAGAVAEIQRAFAAWSQVTNIRFVEVPDSGAAFGATSGGDIRIGGHAMDGRSNILAHGFFPNPNGNGAAGDLHFDIAENWHVRSLNGDPNTLDIFTVAAHEIGHVIGLAHEPSVLALMNPVYNEGINGLQADDIRGAQALYGQLGTSAVPNLLGQWWASGLCSAGISESGGNLTFTNERGEKSTGGLTAANRVTANDWRNLGAKLEGAIVSTAGSYEIRWTNGTTWTQTRQEQWWMSGALATSIRQDATGGATGLTFINERNETATGLLVNGSQVVADNWNHLHGTIVRASDGMEIRWDNGTVWSQANRAAEAVGNWNYKGHCSVVMENGRFEVVNERGDRSSATMLSKFRIVATDWGNLGGDVNYDLFGHQYIFWDNQTTWDRNPGA